MVKIVLGVLLSLVGICLGLYIYEFTDVKNYLIVSVAVVFVVFGIMTLFLAYKNREKKEKEIMKKNAVDVVDTTSSMVNLLERNNALLSEWDKTNETRDKMQLLEMSARVQDSK